LLSLRFIHNLLWMFAGKWISSQTESSGLWSGIWSRGEAEGVQYIKYLKLFHRTPGTRELAGHSTSSSPIVLSWRHLQVA
jgi:hypothetical protein